jgi:hypothetical protein
MGLLAEDFNIVYSASGAFQLWTIGWYVGSYSTPDEAMRVAQELREPILDPSKGEK